MASVDHASTTAMPCASGPRASVMAAAAAAPVNSPLQHTQPALHPSPVTALHYSQHSMTHRQATYPLATSHLPVRRLQLQHLRVRLCCLVKLPRVPQQPRVVVHSIHVLRIDRQRALKRLPRPRVIPQGVQRGPQVAVRIGKVRVQEQSVLEGFLSSAVLAQAVEGASEKLHGVMVLGVEQRGLAVVVAGVHEEALSLEGDAQVDVHLGKE